VLKVLPQPDQGIAQGPVADESRCAVATLAQPSGHAVESRHVRDQRPAADIEEDPVRAQDPRADLDFGAADEARVSPVDHGAFQAFQPVLDAVAGLADDFILAGLDAPHVDARHCVQDHAIVRGAPCHVRRVRARDHRLRRRATVVDASPSELVLLDHGDFPARAGQSRGEGRTGLAGTDDDGVEACGGLCH